MKKEKKMLAIAYIQYSEIWDHTENQTQMCQNPVFHFSSENVGMG